MPFAPTSTIRLCRVKFGNDYKHVIDFASASDQANYFISNTVRTYNNYSYVRKDGYIKLEGNADLIQNCNYVMYRNSNFGNKWFYAFITRFEYQAEQMTYAYIETDVWQTWLFDTTYHPCMVERAHAGNDAIGFNTEPESIDIGELNYTDRWFHQTEYCIIVATTLKPTSPPVPDPDLAGNINGSTYSAVNYLYYDLEQVSLAYLNLLITGADDAGVADHILAVYMCPIDFVPPGTIYPGDKIKPTPGRLRYNTITLATPNNISGYTPRNNKLFIYPYNALYVTNFNGNDEVFNIEMFVDNKPSFNIYGDYMYPPNGKCVPNNYRKADETTSGDEQKYLFPIPLNNYPDCPYTSDTFKNWLAQNSQSNALAIVTSSITAISGLVAGIATANPAVALGGVGAGISGLAKTYTNIESQRLKPKAIKGNLNQTKINNALDLNSIGFYFVQLTYNDALKVDQYFTYYGYATNLLLIPNIMYRRYWDFKKTTDCVVEGNLPQDDLNTIANIWNTGVTVWHDPSAMYNYSLINDIR